MPLAQPLARGARFGRSWSSVWLSLQVHSLANRELWVRRDSEDLRQREFRTVNSFAYALFFSCLITWCVHYGIKLLAAGAATELRSEFWTNLNTFLFMGMAVVLIVGLRLVTVFWVILSLSTLFALALTVPRVSNYEEALDAYRQSRSVGQEAPVGPRLNYEGLRDSLVSESRLEAARNSATMPFTFLAVVAITLTATAVGFVCKNQWVVFSYAGILGLYAHWQDLFPHVVGDPSKSASYYPWGAVLKACWFVTLYLALSDTGTITAKEEGGGTLGGG